ncbi:pyruvate dehydrogenase complex dihydrolipoamide acetyltransferase [Mesorhizobium sp. NBSH29]|uniref:pyruvate dehydrogenase complex dihydrolipoamide acetyltransferase n=1 Tax=Mesorhizobium sp. NBSH29 TaxID=2654249 RepID=UPI001896688D|nr:pyruvate dehydrogenase complex dihydrolipoamide acetyltransferase [Mesorhizobium sp. NBSH29]QPC85958.1 pyruvate dehydrogenase complex dihydrolipoamide acetyltransferase [Mesorhizobium sp. NBSH29]
MPVEVILPKVDMDMATGQISRWFVEEGAAVKQGDVLFEIETDKAAMEIDAPASGIIRNISGKQGIDIPVGEAVAWIFAEGEAAPSAPTPPDISALAETSVPAPSSQERAVDAGPPAAVPEMERSGGSARATPLARRVAHEAGLDIATIPGSGPKGRVVKADVEAAVAGGGAKAPTTSASASVSAAPAKPMSDDAVLKLFEEGSYELIPHDTMRRTIARRLVEAKTTIPHFYLTLDCGLDALLALRSQLNAAAPMRKTDAGEAPAYKLSVNDFIIKAYALALRDVPTANVSWTEANMVQHAHADVGVAVSIPGGLITPIIRKAEEKTLTTISAEIKDMAARARNKKLKPEEYQGGSGAVSNLGMFGIKDFAAVINPPHATILAIGAGEERAVVKDGKVDVATMMSVTLSTDHRAVDGALGAELLVAFKRHIENPMGMLV